MQNRFYHIFVESLARVTIIVLTIVIFLTVPANAHGGRGVNGGQLIDKGSIHIEFIGGQGYGLLLFAISDMAQKPILVDSTFAFAMAEINGQKTQIPLISGGSSMLSSNEGSALRTGDEVWFIARMTNGDTLKAMFTSK